MNTQVALLRFLLLSLFDLLFILELDHFLSKSQTSEFVMQIIAAFCKLDTVRTFSIQSAIVIIVFPYLNYILNQCYFSISERLLY